MFRWKGVYVRKTVLVHFEFTIKSPLSDICSRFLDNFAEMGMTLPYIVSHIYWTMLEKKKQGMQMLLTEVQVRQYWRFSWRFSTPAILFALLVFSWWQNFLSDFTNSGLYLTRVGFVGWFSVIINQEWVWSHLLPGPALSYLGSGAKIHITYASSGNNLESNQHVVLPCHMLEPRWWDIWSLVAQWWLCPFLESSRWLKESRLKNSSVENER